MRRRSDRWVHTGERAGSDTSTCRMADCPSSASCSREPCDLDRVAQEAEAAVGGASDHAEPAAQLVREGVDRGLDEAGVDRRGYGAIGSDRLGGVARDVDELLRHADAPLAVGDGVVELLDHGGAAVFETLDDEELPERARAVERGAHERGGEVEQLSHRPGAGQRRPAEVVVEVEVGFVTPLRRGEPAQGGDHPLAQPRHLHRGPLEPAAKLLRIGGLVEQGDVGDRRAEVRILLEVPHQRLDVGHPPLVAHLSGSYRALCHAPKGRRTGGSVTRASATPGVRWRRPRCRWRRRREHRTRGASSRTRGSTPRPPRGRSTRATADRPG